MSIIKIYNPPTKAGIHSMQIQLETPISVEEARRRLQSGKAPSKIGLWTVGMFYGPDDSNDGAQKAIGNLRLQTIANDCAAQGRGPDTCLQERGVSFKAGDYDSIVDNNSGMVTAYMAYTAMEKDLDLPDGVKGIREAHFDTKAKRLVAVITSDNRSIPLDQSVGLEPATITALVLMTSAIVGLLVKILFFGGVAYIAYKLYEKVKGAYEVVFGKRAKGSSAVPLVATGLVLLFLMRWWRRPAVGVLP